MWPNETTQEAAALQLEMNASRGAVGEVIRVAYEIPASGDVLTDQCLAWHAISIIDEEQTDDGAANRGLCADR